MGLSISHTQTIDTRFWEQYTQLWTNSIDRSPFQSPQLLQFLSRQQDEPKVLIQYSEKDSLLGAVVLVKGNKK